MPTQLSLTPISSRQRQSSMRHPAMLFSGRLLSSVAVLGLLLGTPGLAPIAYGQPVGNQADQPAIDPPTRVGRVARINGTVSYHTAEDTQWQPAPLNFPVTSGQSYWTEPNATADIDVGGTRIVLDRATQLDFDTVDDHNLTASMSQGSAYLAVRSVDPGDSYTVRTPRGTVSIDRPGRYVVQTGNTEQPTKVTVLEGAAEIAGPGVSLRVGPRQTASITGVDNFQGVIGPQSNDQFVAQNAPPPRPIPTGGQHAPPRAVADMTGGEALVEAGSWDSSPEYGQVWYPPVEVGWAPYRHGHWAFVLPWGWTWVDDAPWGFAPFHYGRWAQFGPRWGWVPGNYYEGEYRRPVYAPALVAFIGFGAGVAIGASLGWIPLGPREAYRPYYRSSPGYDRRFGGGNVVNVTNNTYINRSSVTVVNANTMTSSAPVGRNRQPTTPQMLGAAQPMTTPAVRPTTATVGVTPAVARQLGVTPTAATPQRTAPGPSITPRPTAQPGGAAPLPQFQRTQGVQNQLGQQQPGQTQPGQPAALPQNPGFPPRTNSQQPGLGQPNAAAPGAPNLTPGQIQRPNGLPQLQRPNQLGVPVQPPAIPQPGLQPPGLQQQRPGGLPAQLGAPGPTSQPRPPQPAFGQLGAPSPQPNAPQPAPQPAPGGLPPLQRPGQFGGPQAPSPQPPAQQFGTPGLQQQRPGGLGQPPAAAQPARPQPALPQPALPQPALPQIVRPTPQPPAPAYQPPAQQRPQLGFQAPSPQQPSYQPPAQQRPQQPAYQAPAYQPPPQPRPQPSFQPPPQQQHVQPAPQAQRPPPQSAPQQQQRSCPLGRPNC